MTRPRVVTVAHGTRHATGNRVAAELTAAAGARLAALDPQAGWAAEVAYVELCDPLLVDVLAAPTTPGTTTVVVPLLLSTGFHLRQDLPRAVDGAWTGGGARTVLGRSLGPDALVAAAQVERLVEAGAEPGTPVTMVAAGSTDPRATRDLREAAALLGEAWGADVRVATLSGLGDRPADVVQPGDVVSPYLLSPGFFATRTDREARAAGAVVVADVLGPHPLLVDLVVHRSRDLLHRATHPHPAAG